MAVSLAPTLGDSGTGPDSLCRRRRSQARSSSRTGGEGQTRRPRRPPRLSEPGDQLRLHARMDSPELREGAAPTKGLGRARDAVSLPCHPGRPSPGSRTKPSSPAAVRPPLVVPVLGLLGTDGDIVGGNAEQPPGQGRGRGSPSGAGRASCGGSLCTALPPAGTCSASQVG